MPLCKENRANCDGGREYSCLDEHITTQHDALMCKTVKHKKGSRMPQELQICLYTQRGSRRQNST